jgi:hypothetical protein
MARSFKSKWNQSNRTGEKSPSKNKYKRRILLLTNFRFQAVINAIEFYQESRDESVWQKIPKTESLASSIRSESIVEQPKSTGNAIAKSLRRLSKLKLSDYAKRSSTVNIQIINMLFSVANCFRF